MKKVILTSAENGFNPVILTDDGISADHLGNMDGMWLTDAIDAAKRLAAEIGADNAEAWADVSYDTDDGDKIVCESCLEYRWGFDPAEGNYSFGC